MNEVLGNITAIVVAIGSLLVAIITTLKNIKAKVLSNNVVPNKVSDLMQAAETLFDEGEKKLKWVIEQTKLWAAANGIKVTENEITATIEKFMQIINNINK